MLFFCFLSIIIGVFTLIRAQLYNNHYKRRKLYVLMVIFLAIGIGMLIAHAFLDQDMQMRIWGGIAGVLCIYWGGIGIKDLYCCKVMVSAICVDVTNLSTAKYGKQYLPKFRYRYQQKTYEKESQKATEKSNKFKKGQIYNVFINEKHPERVIWRRRVDLADIFIIFSGMVFLITCILA